jgi:hypothetical protein
VDVRCIAYNKSPGNTQASSVRPQQRHVRTTQAIQYRMASVEHEGTQRKGDGGICAGQWLDLLPWKEIVHMYVCVRTLR